mgnify:CR=1 FL=1
MKRLAPATFAAVVAMFAAVPAFAADNPPPASDGSEKVNQVIVYGNDPCPASAGNEITVCARKEEGERYRIPQVLRQSDSPENLSWTQKVAAYETVGDFGTMSCTPSGAGGALGCTQKLIDAAYKEKKGASDVRFSELIQQERDKRLSTIDADAAAEQARVEQLEKEYDAKLAAEREKALPDETPSANAPATQTPPPPGSGQ